MAERLVFVKLPVADLPRARALCATWGFGLDARSSDEPTACVVVSPSIQIMLLTRDRFGGFAARPMGSAGLAAGGTDNDSLQEHGDVIDGRSISDPDGPVPEPMGMARAMPTLPGGMNAAVDA